MGGCQFGLTQQQNAQLDYTDQSFRFIFAIGKGGFGMVWKVEQKKGKDIMALKVMSKANVHSVMNELQILTQLRHRFIINMNCAFQDKRFLYLGMEYFSGGDLRFQLCRVKKFTETQTTCILISLEYLHGNSILHRDIKPENLVFDQNGYLHLTDMGIARVWKPENSSDTSGTPGYMAPEVLCRQNHGVAVDYFAIGVIVYEFMIGYRPYMGKNRQEIREQISKSQIPDQWSEEAADFANRLLQRKPSCRLGVNGPEEVKQHEWFNNFSWNKLQNQTLDAPFLPYSINNYYSNIKLDSQTDIDSQNEQLLRRNSIQGILSQTMVQFLIDLFNGYQYGHQVTTSINTTMQTKNSIQNKNLI